MSRWYRAYEGTVTDAKLGEVALVAGCSRSVAIAAWHCILESCASANDAGRFETTARRVAVVLGEPVPMIEAVFAELASLGMISGNVANAWAARQFESDSSTERSRKHREAKRNADATPTQRCATPPYTETDTDTISNEIVAPAIEPAPAKRPRKAPATAIEGDAQPNPAQIDYAEKAGLTGRRMADEWGRFVDYHLSRGNRMADWTAAWRTWVRNGKTFAAGSPNARAGPQPAKSGQPTRWINAFGASPHEQPDSATIIDYPTVAGGSQI
jgi:hypothetical protein